MIVSIISEYGNQADVDIDLEELDLDNPTDQAKLAAAVKDALKEIAENEQ